VSAIGSQLRNAEYQGTSYIVAPVISAVGDTVIFPANAPYPEFVPAEVLSLATESRNFRPVVMNHPINDSGEYCSANSPEILEKYCYGFVFNSRFEDGRVKSEIWLDPVRASAVGSEAERVIERLQSGEIVEVSEGSYVTIDEVSGIYNGDEYNGVWTLCIPDHLATLSEGVEGACSIAKQGCGANRVNATNVPRNSNTGESNRMAPTSHSSTPVSGSPVQGVEPLVSERPSRSTAGELRSGIEYTRVSRNAAIGRLSVSAMAQARTPTYSGTESSSWSAPSFNQYVKYLHPGSIDTSPKSVSQCSTELKKLISNHSLLGDPEATNISGLTTFPVVNPSNGKLNEKALRNVLSRSVENIIDTDISESALTSAQDMARRLLNSEFGSNLAAASKSVQEPVKEVSNGMKDKNTNGSNKNKSLLSRVTSFLRDGMSNNKLRNSLYDALNEIESGLWYIEDFDTESKTVVYTVRIVYGGGYEYDYNSEVKITNYQRTYNVDSNEKVTINDDRIEVQFEGTYVPVPETTDDTSLAVSAETDTHTDCKCKGKPNSNIKGETVAMDKGKVVDRLIASKRFQVSEKNYLLSLNESVLKALEESLPKPAINGDPEENKSVNHGDRTIIENTPEDEQENKVKEIADNKTGTNDANQSNTPNPPSTTSTTEDRVTLSKSDFEVLMGIKNTFEASQAKRKSDLVKVLASKQSEYSESDLNTMKVEHLERMCNMLKVDKPQAVSVVDYSFARGAITDTDNDSKSAPAPLSVMARIAERNKKSV
jgi:hypothetical protein